MGNLHPIGARRDSNPFPPMLPSHGWLVGDLAECRNRRGWQSWCIAVLGGPAFLDIHPVVEVRQGAHPMAVGDVAYLAFAPWPDHQFAAHLFRPLPPREASRAVTVAVAEVA